MQKLSPKFNNMAGAFLVGFNLASFGAAEAGGHRCENPVAFQNGKTSWYGPDFHGDYTANGERFDQNAMTAAHRTLPFGTLIMVENQNNGEQVVVRINDRGPYAGNRILDLSSRAADRIDMKQEGVVPVSIYKCS